MLIISSEVSHCLHCLELLSPPHDFPVSPLPTWSGFGILFQCRSFSRVTRNLHVATSDHASCFLLLRQPWQALPPTRLPQPGFPFTSRTDPSWSSLLGSAGPTQWGGPGCPRTLFFSSFTFPWVISSSTIQMLMCPKCITLDLTST